jgi:hypothetical protein
MFVNVTIHYLYSVIRCFIYTHALKLYSCTNHAVYISNPKFFCLSTLILLLSITIRKSGSMRYLTFR